jgi:hypothetical protein
MKATEELPTRNLVQSVRNDPPPVFPGEAILADPCVTSSTQPAEDHGFCPECGQLLVGRASGPTWSEPAHPWWAWGLVALGAALTIVFGLSALSFARERAAAEEILRGLPTSEVRLEGPSSQRAALQSEGPPGVVNRYLAAEQHLERARNEALFGVAVLILGISLLARPSARRAATGRVRITGHSAQLDSVVHTLVKGWEMTEIIALSALRLVIIAFLGLLIVRVGSGNAPTWDVVEETLDRVIEIVARLPELVA